MQSRTIRLVPALPGVTACARLETRARRMQIPMQKERNPYQKLKWAAKTKAAIAFQLEVRSLKQSSDRPAARRTKYVPTLTRTACVSGRNRRSAERLVRYSTSTWGKRLTS